jgi:hypothetical protein
MRATKNCSLAIFLTGLHLLFFERKKMHRLRLHSSLPVYKNSQDADAAKDVASHRLRLSVYENTLLVGSLAHLIAHGEPLYVAPPADTRNLSYEQLAEHAIQTGAMKDVLSARSVNGVPQRVPVSRLAPA